MIRIIAGVTLKVAGYPLEKAGFFLLGDSIVSPVSMLLAPVSLPILGLGAGLGFAGDVLQVSGENALERWLRR